MRWILAIVLMSFGWPERLPTKARDFTFDRLSNGYLVYDTYVDKYDPNGKLLFRTGDLNFGPISSFDATDPLKPFIFFRDQGILCPLDNTMSLQGPTLFLYASDFSQVDLVARAIDGQYWCWDGLQNELVKVDGTMQRISSTGNLSARLGLALHPHQLVVVENHVCLADSVHGLLVFDFMGNYSSQTKLPHGARLQPDGKTLLVLTRESVARLDPASPLAGLGASRAMAVPEGAKLYRGRMFWLENGALNAEAY